MTEIQDYLFKNIIIPSYFSLKNGKRLKIYEQISKRNKLSIEELEEIRWIKLKNLISHCHSKIPYYQELFEKNDIHPCDIKTTNDFLEIPELTKEIIRDNIDKLMDPDSVNKKLTYTSTSGSTGIPLRIPHLEAEHDYACALKMRSNAWTGWDYWDKSLLLISDRRHTGQLNSLKGRATLSVFRKTMLDTNNITQKTMFEWVELIKKEKPKQIYGYSSLIAEFACFIVENNISLTGIKGVYSTAEPLKERDIISQAFSAPVYDQYGCSEVACIAHECSNGKMHVNIDEIMLEFKDDLVNFEAKKIICTPLYLYTMPLLRYNTGDSAVIGEKETCDCGLSYPTLKLKIGRISDNLLSSTGKFVSGIVLNTYMGITTKGVKQFQIIQEDLFNIKIKLVASDEFRSYNEFAIKNLLSEMLGTNLFNLDFEHLDFIPPNNNGKFSPIISKIANKTLDKSLASVK